MKKTYNDHTKSTPLFTKRWLIPLLALFLVACGGNTTQTPTELPTHVSESASYPDLGEAPELQNEVWLNTDEPLRLANLRGKVVLLDMWTFG